MSWFLGLLMQRPCSPTSLLLLCVVGGQAGLDVAGAVLCSRWGQRSDRNLSVDGDVMIGGLFNLYYIPSATQQEYTQLQYYERCSR